MGWEKELEELRRREALAEQMGGEEKVARQHGRGKMDARARLAALCDDGTFREIGKIVFPVEIRDPEPRRPPPFVVVAKDQAALHLTADRG